MLENLLTTLLQAVITVAVPILSAFAVKWLNAKAAQASAQATNEKARAYINEAAEAVSTAVAFTSQTYVDELKKSQAFTTDNQKEALNKAKDKALALLSQSAIEFLNMAYGDAAEFLTAQIEKEVRFQKNSDAFLIPAAIETDTQN